MLLLLARKAPWFHPEAPRDRLCDRGDRVSESHVSAGSALVLRVGTRELIGFGRRERRSGAARFADQDDTARDGLEENP
jgi:hypothetical protein